MKMVEIGSLRMIYGGGMPRIGIIIECTKEEAMNCSRLIYKDVEIKIPKQKDQTSKMLCEFIDRIATVDERLRKEKASKRYTRDEVLAMLDEIDPEFIADDKGERK